MTKAGRACLSCEVHGICQQLAEHLGTLLPLVQGALLDTDPSVRQVRI